MGKQFLPGAMLTLLAFGIAACSAAQTPPEPTPTVASLEVGPADTPTASGEPSAEPTRSPTSEVVEQADLLTPAEPALTRLDTQGGVQFAVTPLNLTAPGETLDFAVSLNTHSVDLSWDLAAQSVLATDTGQVVKGLSWPVGGGHHYEGTLTFPAKTADGTLLLVGSKTLTLNIRDAGAPERVFVWDISP